MTGNRQVRFLGECERATLQSYPTRAVEKVTFSLTLILITMALKGSCEDLPMEEGNRNLSRES